MCIRDSCLRVVVTPNTQRIISKVVITDLARIHQFDSPHGFWVLKITTFLLHALLFWADQSQKQIEICGYCSTKTVLMSFTLTTWHSHFHHSILMKVVMIRSSYAVSNSILFLHPFPHVEPIMCLSNYISNLSSSSSADLLRACLLYTSRCV